MRQKLSILWPPYFIATPMGWVTALALGVGAVAFSVSVGKGAKIAYNSIGEGIDLTRITKVDQLCK